MRWAILVVILFFDSSLSAQVRINEIYYDHPGRDEGHEFVELFNSDAGLRSLEGYQLEFHNGSAEGWKIIWQGSGADSIGAEGLFVVGGGDVPRVNVISDFTLENGPDAIRLVHMNGGGVEDLIGYGDLSGAEYYETESAADVSEGSSLGRHPDGHDTDHNARDFRALEPSPGRFNQPRRTVAMSAGRDLPLARALATGVAEEIRVFVVNRGLEPTGASEVAVDVVDSSESGAVPLYATVVPHAIAAGDSVPVAFVAALDIGYHRLCAVAFLDNDERPRDNMLTLLRRVGESSLLISEVMSYPAEGCPEYVELHNASGTEYRLDGVQLKDRTHAPVRLPALASALAPGGYLVVTEDRDRLIRCFAGLDTLRVVELAGTWPTLNQSGTGGEADSIIVLDRYALPLDRIAYPPQPSESRGRSLERVDLYPGVRSHVFVLSAPGGSPGRRHDRVISESPRESGMTVSPNPFDPMAGEALLITVPARAEPTRSWVQLFDMGGRRVCDIGSSMSLPFLFVWNGLDGRGQPVSSGIYIMVCEHRGLRTGTRVVERVVLGCGKKSP
jgi:hypothetical protein